MDKKIFLILGLIILGILFFSIFVFANLNKNYFNENIKSNYSSCENDFNCEDGNSCTIDYCHNKECCNTEIVLCYQDDGCCPSGCTAKNDNDC